MSEIDVQQIENFLVGAQTIVDTCARYFAELCQVEGRIDVGRMNRYQVELYELAHAATQVMAAKRLWAHAAGMVDVTQRPSRLTVQLALLYTAETLCNLQNMLQHREASFGVTTEMSEVQ